MAVYLGSNWVGETRAIYSDTGEGLVDFIENGVSGAFENSEVTKIAPYAFDYTSITTVNFPNVTSVGSHAFQTCTSLSQVSLSAATTIGTSAFAGCSLLSQVSLYAATTIESFAFYYCSSLAQVYLLGSAVCSLPYVNAFYMTPISRSTYLGTYGSIYVPASLYSSYITATNWTAYSSRFASVYGTVTWGFISADGQRYVRIRDNDENVKTGSITVVSEGISYDYREGTRICDEATWDTLSPNYGYSYSAIFNNGTTSHSLTMSRSDYDDPFVGYLLI